MAGYRYVYTDKQMPAVHGAMAQVSNEIRAGAEEHGLDRTVLELVNLRASQINGCAFCLHLHTHLALRGGESPSASPCCPPGGSPGSSPGSSRRH